VPTKVHPRTVTAEREREIREVLGIAGTATTEELAIALRCSDRTVLRLGLPYRMVAGKRAYDLRAAKERLQERQDRRTTASEEPAPT
jgi:hypothetical protein